MALSDRTTDQLWTLDRSFEKPGAGQATEGLGAGASTENPNPSFMVRIGATARHASVKDVFVSASSARQVKLACSGQRTVKAA